MTDEELLALCEQAVANKPNTYGPYEHGWVREPTYFEQRLAAAYLELKRRLAALAQSKDCQPIAEAPPPVIILNGRYVKIGVAGGLFPCEYGKISYDDVVEWSGHNIDSVFTVVYAMPSWSGKQDGSLIKGESVSFEDGMIFSVANTSNA